MMLRKKRVEAFLLIGFVVCFVLAERAFAQEGFSYAGLEFFGSSQMTRDEIEKELHLKPGASTKSIENGVERLRQAIDKRRLLANIQMIVDPPDKIFVVVDFEDPLGKGVPVRNLTNPHHVETKSEKPDILLAKLRERLNRLDSEGRHWTDSYDHGWRSFSDEPAQQIVSELLKYGSVMRDEWLEIVVSDPNPDRRCDAIELLNWGGNYVDTCARLIPSLDDSHHAVRGSVVRYIFPRLKQLPDDFPYDPLAMGLVRQLKRPSHEDRNKSMHCILALMKKRPMMIAPFKQTLEKDVETLARTSRISSLRNTAVEVLAVFAQPLPKPRPIKVPEAGF